MAVVVVLVGSADTMVRGCEMSNAKSTPETKAESITNR